MIVRVPGPVPSRSKIVRANGFAFFNIAPAKKEPDVSVQMTDALSLVDSRLKEIGLSKSAVLSITVFIAGMGMKAAMNDAWEAWVDRANAPIRACIGAELDGADLVELSVVAADAK